jgi:hypothetical protein
MWKQQNLHIVHFAADFFIFSINFNVNFVSLTTCSILHKKQLLKYRFSDSKFTKFQYNNQ